VFKTGLYRIEELTDLKKSRTFLGGYRRVSITLYDQLINHPDADAWAQHILYMFADGRGAFKRTYNRRFEEYDAFCMAHIAAAFDPLKPLAVHDAAVSDGRTACDFFAKVAAFNPQVAYFASDYQPTLRIIESGGIRITLDRRSLPLEIVYPPFVFNLIQPERFITYPVNYLFYLYATRVVLPRLMTAYASGAIKARDMKTFSPMAVSLATSDQRFTLLDYDLMEPSPLGRPMNILRVMNVLNPLYFSDQQLRTVAHNFFHGLADGGLLILGSNEDAGTPVHGGIYQRGADRFSMVKGLGRLHYAHPAMLEYRAP
jgi:hypothetical protein